MIPFNPDTAMHRFALLLYLKLCLCVLCAFILAPLATMASLLAGAATVDITPKVWPIYLRGSFNIKPSDTAHDPLHSRALVLQNGDTQVAIVIVDSCMVSRANQDRAKSIASKATGIPTSRILCAATHTHSAPYDFARYGTDPEKAYVEQLVNGIAQSVIDAHAALQPAEIGYASSTEPSEVFNRRWFLEPDAMPPNPFGEYDLVKMNPGRGNPALLHPAGTTDPEVYALSVRTAEGRPLALLGNYSLHYVGRTPPNQVSADYFGEFARLIHNRIIPQNPAPEFVGLLSNGTSGDINNIDFDNPRPNREYFEQIRIVAAKVADAAYKAYTSIEHSSDPIIAMEETELTFNRRVPTESQIADARSVLEQAKDRRKAAELPQRADAYAERVLNFAEECEESSTVEVLVQTLRIGDLAICTSPFETFVETGLQLKRSSPFPHTFTIELANGAEGYLPTPAQHQLGGYETWLTTNKVEVNASEKMTQRLLEMLEGLK